MDPDLLWTPAGTAALARADELADADPLVASTALRASGFGPELAAAALTQATLRRRATAKFGPDAQRMFFTRPGLEQSTRAVVADRRAARLAAAGIATVADLGCGIGADTLAFARAGLRVLAVESDATTAAIARANADALGLSALVEVRAGDAAEADLSDVDAVFCDPARRDGGRRVFDPNAYSPPWPFVVGLATRVPATVLKLAPGVDHELIPAGAEAEWVSVDGDVVEAAFWCGPLAGVPRRATVLRGAAVATLTGTGVAGAAVGADGPYLFDPDGAVVRAHLIAELATGVSGRLADPHIAYVFADAPTATPLGRCFEVLDRVPAGVKPLRAALRGIGRLEIRKRGLAIDPDRLRRDLRLSGEGSATLVLARIGDRPAAWLCRPAVEAIAG